MGEITSLYKASLQCKGLCTADLDALSTIGADRFNDIGHIVIVIANRCFRTFIHTCSTANAFFLGKCYSHIVYLPRINCSVVILKSL